MRACVRVMRPVRVRVRVSVSVGVSVRVRVCRRASGRFPDFSNFSSK